MLIFNLGIGLRLAGGLIIGILYYYYYQHGDTISYFNIATRFNEANGNGLIQYLEAITAPIPTLNKQPRTEFFIKIIGPLLMLSGGSYWMLSMYLSLFNFALLWLLVSRLTMQFPIYRKLFYFCFLLFPSPVFFSSGVTKDAIVNGLVAYLISALLIFYHKKIKLIEIIPIFIGLFVLINLKHYAAGVLLVSGTLMIIARILHKYHISYTYLLYLLILIAGSGYVHLLHPWFRLERLPLTIYENHQLILEMSTDSSQLKMNLSPTYASMIKNSPLALFSGLFRPLLWEAKGWLSLLVRFENFLALTFFAYSCYHFKKWRLDIRLITLIIFICTLAVFLSLSTPNFGSLARYKSLFLPYFIYLVTLLPYQYLLSRNTAKL
jgi:hypothetical protein